LKGSHISLQSIEKCIKISACAIFSVETENERLIQASFYTSYFAVEVSLCFVSGREKKGSLVLRMVKKQIIMYNGGRVILRALEKCTGKLSDPGMRQVHPAFYGLAEK